VLSMYSMKKANPTPSNRPMSMPRSRFRTGFGLKGAVGVSARSTIRMLLDLRPAATEASFNRESIPSYTFLLVSTSRWRMLYWIRLSLSRLAWIFCSSSAS